MNESEQIDVVDIKIFPHRFLKAETTEKVLNALYELDGTVRLIIHGEGLPELVNAGPAKGMPVNHTERKTIIVKDQELELLITVGEIVATVEAQNLEKYMEELKTLLDDVFAFGYQTSVGVFTKQDATISDHMKYGPNFENEIDKRFIGMADPRSKTQDTVKIIK